MAPRLRRLEPGPTAVTTVRDEYDVERPPPPDRPWIAVSMVASVDGSVSLDGASGGLGNANDREVLRVMRSLADVIVVGAATAEAEGYGPPARAGQRIGLATNSGRVDPDSELIRSGAGFALAPTTASIDERVDVIRAGDGQLDLATAIRRIPDLIGPTSFVLAEGGPRFNGALLEAGLIDEIVLNWSPRLVGGDGSRLTDGAPERRLDLDLAHLLVDDDGFVFSRWVRRSAS